MTIARLFHNSFIVFLSFPVDASERATLEPSPRTPDKLRLRIATYLYQVAMASKRVLPLLAAAPSTYMNRVLRLFHAALSPLCPLYGDDLVKTTLYEV